MPMDAAAMEQALTQLNAQMHELATQNAALHQQLTAQ
jgi:hypothetical protein